MKNLSPSVANLTHLSDSPVNSPLHLRCRRYDTPCRLTCKQPLTPPLHFPKLRQPIWPAASVPLRATAPTIYLLICKNHSTLRPFMVLNILPAFIKILL